MVEYEAHNPHDLDRVFHALADPTRRAMLQALSGGEHNIRSLAEPFSMSFAGASKHVKVLETAGLVQRRIQGRSHYCRLRPERLRQAQEWLAYYERFWTRRLDTLETLLQAQQEASPDE